jgi:hypothetical protein
MSEKNDAFEKKQKRLYGSHRAIAREIRSAEAIAACAFAVKTLVDIARDQGANIYPDEHTSVVIVSGGRREFTAVSEEGESDFHRQFIVRTGADDLRHIRDSYDQNIAESQEHYIEYAARYEELAAEEEEARHKKRL